MNIFYNNKIYFFDNNDLEKNVIFLKLKDRFNLDDKETKSIIDLYISKKRYKCNYSNNTEKMIYNYINEIL